MIRIVLRHGRRHVPQRKLRFSLVNPVRYNLRIIMTPRVKDDVPFLPQGLTNPDTRQRLLETLIDDIDDHRTIRQIPVEYKPLRIPTEWIIPGQAEEGRADKRKRGTSRTNPFFGLFKPS